MGKALERIIEARLEKLNELLKDNEDLVDSLNDNHPQAYIDAMIRRDEIIFEILNAEKMLKVAKVGEE